MQNDTQTFTIEELAYKLEERKKKNKEGALFLIGAGVSATGGMPLANEIMSDLLEKKKEDPRVKKFTKEDKENYSTIMEILSPSERTEYFEQLAEEGILPSEQNLHAKLFVAMTGKISNWYLGSANCSDPAQGRNIEFMVELKSENTSALKTKDVFNVLTNPDKADGISLFTPYNFAARISVEEYKKIDLDIRRIKYDLSKLTLKGKCNIIEGGTSYNLEIEIDAVNFSLPVDYKVKFKPLSEQQKATIALKPNEINTIKDFTGYSETALTPFLEFEIWKKSERYSHFLLAMEIELPESRLNKIFTSIINSREKFLKYLTFLLTGEDTKVIVTESIADKRNTQPNDESWAFTGTPVYEKLLIAASRYPNKLKSIDALILRLKSESSDLDEPIITAEFESFWQVFQTFMLNKK